MTAKDYWLARGATLGGDGAAARVRHLGDPAAEARLAADGADPLLVPLLGVTRLRVAGSDRTAFLHGQLSNDVQGLPAGACNHTLQLDVRGRVVGEATLCVRDGDIVLAVDDGRGRQVHESLAAHVVFDDVAITELGDGGASLSVQGPGWADVVEGAFGAVPEAGAFVQVPLAGADGAGAQALLVRRRRARAGGVDVHLGARLLPEAVAALEGAGAAVAGEDALALMRVLAGVPSAARDGAEGALPQELALEGAVSFAKGCYLGQEIMARIAARGTVRKGLARFRLVPEAPARLAPARLEGRPLRSGEREVGRVGTVSSLPDGGLVALAVVRRDLADAAGLRVESERAGAIAAEPWPWPAAGGTGGDVPQGGRVQPEDTPGTGL